jgi:hypothetical protein
MVENSCGIVIRTPYGLWITDRKKTTHFIEFDFSSLKMVKVEGDKEIKELQQIYVKYILLLPKYYTMYTKFLNLSIVNMYILNMR